MSTPPIHVHFDDAGDERRLIFEGALGPDGPRGETWWKLPESLPAPPVLDTFVCGHVQWAAMLGQDLVVHGPMSRGGLFNMGQLLEIRHALSPERYRRAIAVVPDRVVSAPRPAGDPGSAIAAFSGGLDSTFTAVRHARRLIGDAAYRVVGLVIVLGFDVPLTRADRFDETRRRAEPLARALDLPLHPVVTNAMHLGGRAWPQSALPLFGSVLANFSDACAVGLASAGAPYGTPRFGISHPPMLDALASNQFFTLVSDGGGYGRTDKIEAIRDVPEALAGLRVCWQGDDPARNCGRCEKCVMTRLNFLAAGIDDPPCFDEPLALEHIAALPMPSLDTVRDLYRTCWNELEARGTTGPAVDLLRRRLARVPPDRLLAHVRRLGGVARRLVPARLRHRIHDRLPPALRPG
jgi:hypothetical protein